MSAVKNPRVKAIAMARGTIILDENLMDLEKPLSEMNIHVRVPPQSTADKDIAKNFLTNRVFVTNNSKDFIKYASSYDIGIIATENVSKDPAKLVEMISEAIIKFNVWSIRHGFILKLRQNGKHLLTPLTE